jgi:hypothetical protein
MSDQSFIQDFLFGKESVQVSYYYPFPDLHLDLSDKCKINHSMSEDCIILQSIFYRLLFQF